MAPPRTSGLNVVQACVASGHVAVLGLDQNVAVPIDEDSTKRMIAVGQRAAGDLERPAQKMLVEL